MKFIERLFVLAISMLAFTVPAYACDDNDEDGLDVGLVLSGGGALASTQIGAIQVLDELGIPIHCIAGTSFGSVVGGLYASGYSGDEIANIFLESDWNNILVPDKARNSKSYLQKEQEEEYFSGYFAGVDRNGVRLPSGLASMQGLRSFFRQKFAHIPIGSDFDEIGLPFRAVATDLQTGDSKAFGQGDIVESILASMAVPAAYAPRKIDGRYYVDGGMSAQLPISTVQAMGADIIIAIDTTIAPTEITGNADIGVVSQQLLQIVVYRNFKAQVANMQDGDVLVRPDISSLSVAGFSSSEIGFASGDKAMREQISALMKIKALAAPSRREFKSRVVTEIIETDIKILNTSIVSDEVIRRQFSAKPEEPTSRRLRDLIAFGGFEEVDLARTTDGAQLSVTERSIGRNLIQAGMKTSNTFDGNSSFTLLGRLSRRPLGKTGGELDISVEFGTDFGVKAQLYYPLGDSGQYFIQPEVYYSGKEIDFDIGKFRIGEFWQQRAGFKTRLGRELGNWGVIALEADVLVGKLDAQITLIENFDVDDYTRGGVGMFFAADTLDRLNWPTSGLKLTAQAQQLYSFDGGASTTDRFSLSITKAQKFGDFGVVLSGRAQSVENDRNEPVEILRLGGFRRLSAYPEYALPTNNYKLGSVEVFKRITRSDGIFSLPVYIGGLIEYAEVDFDFLEIGASEDFVSGGMYIGAETPFGPAFFGGAIGQDDAASVYVYLGRSF